MRIPPVLAFLALMVVSCAGDTSESTVSSSVTLAPTTTTSIAAATTPATTVPSPTTTTTVITTTSTLTPVTDLEPGLFCRDLRSLDYSYTEAVHYWAVEGRPDRMDADGNGIPCETVYPEGDVVAYWGESPPTTAVAVRRYVVGETTYFPPSLPGAGEYYGSGCSPGSSTLPDGIWFGHIESASSTAVQFDLICFAPGKDGVADLTNDNPNLRTVPIAPDAVVHAIAPDGHPDELQDYSRWYLDPGEEGFCPPEGCWDVWLYINGGEVTEIVQLWFA
jgi:hypothetical protein